jgi:hypothetical protein
VVQRRFEQQRDQWLKDFYQLRSTDPDAVFIGVGAAAKANTWLTWHGLNKTHLHCITDSSTHKQGKYTPLSRILFWTTQNLHSMNDPYALNTQLEHWRGSSACHLKYQSQHKVFKSMKYYNINKNIEKGLGQFTDERGTITDLFYKANMNHGCIITNEPRLYVAITIIN